MIVGLMTFKCWIPFIVGEVVLHGQACEYQLRTVCENGDFAHDGYAG